MKKEQALALTQNHRGLFRFLFSLHNRFPFVNKIRGKIKLDMGLSYMKGCTLSGGPGNTLVVGDYAWLTNCRFHMEGTGNTVIIGPWCRCDNADFWIEDSGNTITLGEHTALRGDIQLAAMEGTSITVGRDCLFSRSIHIRTGDSHSLLDKETHKRINPSRSVTIGDHVWVGTEVTILKGTTVPQGCVVGARSLLCKEYPRAYSVLAGVPAREVRQNVDWAQERV